MTIRIASYNLWNGSGETYFRLVDFIKEQKFDVLCLQEINGWEDGDYARLKEFADRTGYTDYVFGNSNSEYKLVTLSTLPITARTVHAEGFWHCFIETHVKVGDKELVVLNVHLDPWKEEPRLREISRLLELIDLSKPTVLTGDFNSVSRSDKYPPEFITELAKRKFYKFGQTELDYRVTDTITAAGFVDMAARLNTMDKTAPTAYGLSKDKGEAVPVSEAPARIDYAYVSGDIVPSVRNFETVKTDETEKISDHYPIVLTYDDGQMEPQPIIELPAEKPVPKQSEPMPETKPIEEVEQPDNSATEGEIRLH